MFRGHVTSTPKPAGGQYEQMHCPIDIVII